MPAGGWRKGGHGGGRKWTNNCAWWLLLQWLGLDGLGEQGATGTGVADDVVQTTGVPQGAALGEVLVLPDLPHDGHEVCHHNIS